MLGYATKSIQMNIWREEMLFGCRCRMEYKQVLTDIDSSPLPVELIQKQKQKREKILLWINYFEIFNKIIFIKLSGNSGNFISFVFIHYYYQ